MMRLGPRYLTAVGLTALAACTGSGSADPMVGCMMQVNPPGSYDYAAGGPVPVATPGPGGTQAGADALNACARAQIATSGRMTIETEYPDGTQRVETRRAGASTVKSYAYGTPPSSRSGKGSAALRPRVLEPASAETVGGGVCPPNAPFMYRGTLYCPKR